jgi:hypothetical protein
MPTISTSPWAATAAAAPPRDAVVRAALLGCRDLLRAALDGPAAAERPGAHEGAAQVALAAVEAALAQQPEPLGGSRPRHLDVLDRPVELPADLRANIRLV